MRRRKGREMTGKKTLFNVGYYKKGGAFTGSDAGMRYRVAKTGDGVLTAWAWPEPFAFAETPDERKVTFEAELSDEGLERIAAWLNTRPPEA